MELTKLNGYAPQGFAWTPTLDELLEPKLQLVNRKEDATGTFYGKVKNNFRKNENIEERYGLVFDVDKCDVDIIEALDKAFEGYQSVIHTTHSHDPKHNKYCYRVFMTTTEPIKPEDYDAVFVNFVNNSKTLSELRDKGFLDMSAEQYGRFYYDWSCHPNRQDDAYCLIKNVTSSKAHKPDITRIKQATIKETNSPSVDPFKNFQEEYKEGTRNNSLAREVADLFKLSNSFNDVTQEAHKINQVKCVPPLDIKEVDAIVNSISKQERFNESETDGMFKDLEIFKLTWDNLTIAPPIRKWTLDGFIPQGIVGGIVATGGTGKSFFSLQLCIAVASGMSLYNLWSTTNNKQVVYISGEETKDEVVRRMFYLTRNMSDVFKKRVIENIHIISFADQFYSFIKKDRMGNVIITSVVEKLVEKLLSHIKDTIGLIVIDPISRFRDADENDNNAGTRFVQALQQLRVGLHKDATLMSCHHANKGAEVNGASQNNSRGASSVVDGMRFILNMNHMTKTQQNALFGTEKTREDRYVELHLVKTNYTNFIDPLYLHVEDEGVLVPSNKPIGDHLNNQVLQKIREVTMTKSAFKLKYSGKDNVFGLSERPLVTKIDELKELDLIEIPKNKTMKLTTKGWNQLESDAGE